MKTQFPNPSRRRHRSAARTLRSQASEGSQVLCGLGAELEALSARLQQASQDLDQCDPEEEDTVYRFRERLRGLKQAARDQLPGITQEAYPWIVAAEFWKPGLLSAFGEFWPCLPDLLQGPATWLGFMGRLRSVLREALDANPARTSVAAGYSGESDLTPVATGHPAVHSSVAPMEPPKEHYRVKEVATRWAWTPKPYNGDSGTRRASAT